MRMPRQCQMASTAANLVRGCLHILLYAHNELMMLWWFWKPCLGPFSPVGQMQTLWICFCIFALCMCNMSWWCSFPLHQAKPWPVLTCRVKHRPAGSTFVPSCTDSTIHLCVFLYANASNWCGWICRAWSRLADSAFVLSLAQSVRWSHTCLLVLTKAWQGWHCPSCRAGGGLTDSAGCGGRQTAKVNSSC